jgi:uncharacterized cupin superfamily protein
VKAVKTGDRIVKNIFEAPFESYDAAEGDYEGASILQLDGRRPVGTGFHAFKMAPGSKSTPHEHTSDEMFYVLEGELIDNDGARYRRGDMVMLKAGTQHWSYTPTGCTLLIYIETAETNFDGEIDD